MPYRRGRFVSQLNGHGKGTSLWQRSLHLGSIGQTPEGSSIRLVHINPIHRAVIIVLFPSLKPLSLAEPLLALARSPDWEVGHVKDPSFNDGHCLCGVNNNTDFGDGAKCKLVLYRSKGRVDPFAEGWVPGLGYWQVVGFGHEKGLLRVNTPVVQYRMYREREESCK